MAMTLRTLFDQCFVSATRNLSEREKCRIARQWYEAGVSYRRENGIPVDEEEHRRKLSEFQAWEDSTVRKAA